MTLDARTRNHPTALSGRAWSIDRQGPDVPDDARSLRKGALILVVIGDAGDPWSDRTRRAALDLAASIGARILFYDRSAESRFIDPYASGAWTSDNPWSHGGSVPPSGGIWAGVLTPPDGRHGVAAWAWLPQGVGAGAISEVVERFGCDLVVLPAELKHRGPPAGPWAVTRRTPAMAVPVLVAGADGSLREWQFANELSRVEFAVRQFGLLTVRGHFSEFEVRLAFDEAVPETTRVEVRIVAASLTTGLGVRDRALRSSSFFDVERHPDITFVSTSVAGSALWYAIGSNRPRNATCRLRPLIVSSPCDVACFQVSQH